MLFRSEAEQHHAGAAPDLEDAPRLQLAQPLDGVVEPLAHRVGGVDAVKALAKRQRGKQFDPTIAAVMHDNAAEVLADLDAVQTWRAVIDAEPALARTLSAEEFERALTAVANFIDLKSPFTLGHSVAVSHLVAGAGMQLDLSDDEVRTLRLAGLVHDFGRLGVSNTIWDKPGPLGIGEWERVRIHP